MDVSLNLIKEQMDKLFTPQTLRYLELQAILCGTPDQDLPKEKWAFFSEFLQCMNAMPGLLNSAEYNMDSVLKMINVSVEQEEFETLRATHLLNKLRTEINGQGLRKGFLIYYLSQTSDADNECELASYLVNSGLDELNFLRHEQDEGDKMGDLFFEIFEHPGVKAERMYEGRVFKHLRKMTYEKQGIMNSFLLDAARWQDVDVNQFIGINTRKKEDLLPLLTRCDDYLLTAKRGSSDWDKRLKALYSLATGMESLSKNFELSLYLFVNSFSSYMNDVIGDELRQTEKEDKDCLKETLLGILNDEHVLPLLMVVRAHVDDKTLINELLSTAYVGVLGGDIAAIFYGLHKSEGKDLALLMDQVETAYERLEFGNTEQDNEEKEVFQEYIIRLKQDIINNNQIKLSKFNKEVGDYSI